MVLQKNKQKQAQQNFFKVLKQRNLPPLLSRAVPQEKPYSPKHELGFGFAGMLISPIRPFHFLSCSPAVSRKKNESSTVRLANIW